MDPGIAILIGEGLKISLAMYLAHQRASGKTEDEIKQMFNTELDKALAFNPQTDIKDV